MKVTMTFEETPQGTVFKCSPSAEDMIAKHQSGNKISNAEFLAMIAGNAVLFKLKEIKRKNIQDAQILMPEMNHEVEAKQAEIIKQLHRKGKI